MKQARSSHSIHGEHHHHRPSSRGSSNDHGREEDHRRRRPQPNFHGFRPSHAHEDKREDGYYRNAKARLPSVQLPCFNGSSDPNVYLDWEAKCEQIFETHKILDEHKYKLATLEFSDYAKEWWRTIVMDIMYRKKPLVVSWNTLKEYMRARFIPHSRKEHLLKFQRLPQGHRMVLGT
ncbi:uncharacterized protein [Phaseolus vulgaris]|uniref:uncharacterized protein n=1 Tax=Phaseolus vulgaris TaxID=3885 RepID=UPI0035C9FA0B